MIARPVEEVFAFLADLENDAKWRKEWAEGHTTTEGLVGVGTTTTLVPGTLGGRPKAVYQITQYEPNVLVEWTTVKGPLPLTFRRACESVEGGTRVTFTYGTDDAAGIGKRLLLTLAKPFGKKALQGDFPTLTGLMQSGAT